MAHLISRLLALTPVCHRLPPRAPLPISPLPFPGIYRLPCTFFSGVVLVPSVTSTTRCARPFTTDQAEQVGHQEVDLITPRGASLSTTRGIGQTPKGDHSPSPLLMAWNSSTLRAPRKKKKHATPLLSLAILTLRMTRNTSWKLDTHSMCTSWLLMLAAVMD